jgi:type I restriction enzyme S subunit
LRQSLLTAAFSGKFVSQDRNDEPAFDLLKRIRAQKGDVPKGNGRNQKRKKAATRASAEQAALVD